MESEFFTPEQFGNMAARLSEKAADARRVAERRAEREARGGRAATSAERVAKHVAAKNELAGRIPPCANPDEREACRRDLVRFGLRYGGDFIRRPPSERMEAFIRRMQTVILEGGKIHVRWPRGKGKSAWSKIAAKWALVYGHRRFCVVVGAVQSAADQFRDEVWRSCRFDANTRADFPEISVPVDEIGESPQRRAYQRFNGRPTFIEENARMAFKRFAVLEGFPNTGGFILSRGADSAIRGANLYNTRPDFVFVDDPQTDASARSPASVDAIERFIMGTLEAMSDTNTSIASVMASTAIEPDDVSERFADPRRHSEWATFTEPFVVSWPKNRAPMEKYLELLEADDAARDPKRTRARAWYSAHRAEIEDGVEMLDPADGDYAHGDVSAFQYALHKLKVMKARFYAEYQLAPERSTSALRLDPWEVARHVNGVPRGVLPRGMSRCVAFCDVNSTAGLRWGILAVGAARQTAIVDYGRWPAGRKPLFPVGTPTGVQGAFVKAGVAAVARIIMAKRYALEGSDGVVRPLSIVFDGGNWTKDIAEYVALSEAARRGDPTRLPVGWSKGFDWSHYLPRATGRYKSQIGEYWHLSEAENGEFLAIQADYWREVAQGSWLVPPGQPGSCAFWGSSAEEHYPFAKEVCAEELKLKFERPDPRHPVQWEWRKTGENHYGDVLSGCFAVASAVGIYSADASDAAAAEEDAGLLEARPAAPQKRKRFVLKHGGGRRL